MNRRTRGVVDRLADQVVGFFVVVALVGYAIGWLVVACFEAFARSAHA